MFFLSPSLSLTHSLSPSSEALWKPRPSSLQALWQAGASHLFLLGWGDEGGAYVGRGAGVEKGRRGEKAERKREDMQQCGNEVVERREIESRVANYMVWKRGWKQRWVHTPDLCGTSTGALTSCVVRKPPLLSLFCWSWTVRAPHPSPTLVSQHQVKPTIQSPVDRQIAARLFYFYKLN